MGDGGRLWEEGMVKGECGDGFRGVDGWRWKEGMDQWGWW